MLSLSVFEAAIRVKSNASDKITFENQKKGENMEIKEFFYIHLHLKEHLNIEFTVC